MNKKLFIAAIFIIFIGIEIVFFVAQSAQADSNENVSGWAWSENIGWISFNNSNTNGGINYGVNIENDGNLTGYAWSENIGWIDFNPSGPYPTCPASTCPSGSPNYSAKLDKNTKKVTGWVKAIGGNTSQSGGWDGWILLGPIVKNGTDYGVRIDNNGDFDGWAWGADVIGWIHFQGSNYTVHTSFITPPRAENLQIDSDNTTYCGIAKGTGKVTFKWVYKDDTGNPETKFDFRVNDVNNVNDPNAEVDRTFSGLSNPSGSINYQSADVVINPQSDKLVYNKKYYWWVKVYNDKGASSDWVEGPSFQTATYAYPWPDFTWTPVKPVINEEIKFSNNSTCYDTNNNIVPCSSWLWTIPNAIYVASTTPASKEPHIKFSSFGTYPATLKATDSSGHSCSATKNIPVSLPYPGWTEIPPY